MSHDDEQLNDLRKQIDAVDADLHQLLNQRASLAQRVAEIKQGAKKSDEDVVYYRPERESQVLRSVMDRNEGPLSDEDVARLFREIMSCCLALEKPMTIAFLGPEGTYTHAAVQKHFGHFVQTSPLTAIDEVFREVESGQAAFGIVPVENSTEGMVNHTLDSLIESPLHISGEVTLRIHHHLLTASEVPLDDIKVVYAHQQALAQCRKWLDSHLPKAERIAVSSNALAAQMVLDEPEAAGIAGELAVEKYGVLKAAENIEDRPDNTTRFLVVGRESVPMSGTDKSSILVSVKNKPGALFHVLEPFHQHNISLTRLETRPSPSGTWSYVFFIDFEGHMDDPNVRAVIDEISNDAVDVKRLGSYPVGVV